MRGARACLCGFELHGGCHVNGGYMIIVNALSLDVDAQTLNVKSDFTIIFLDIMDTVSACSQCSSQSMRFSQHTWLPSMKQFTLMPFMILCKKYAECCTV
ncbi:MAG: hypothetical protein HUJ51_02210 [Eggerthellaceae bacterium]|nr:hypothetical protein [Eggerthellaceae bacterium]